MSAIASSSKYDQYDFPTQTVASETGVYGHLTTEQQTTLDSFRSDLLRDGYSDRLDSLTLVRRCAASSRRIFS